MSADFNFPQPVVPRVHGRIHLLAKGRCYAGFRPDNAPCLADLVHNGVERNSVCVEFKDIPVTERFNVVLLLTVNVPHIPIRVRLMNRIAPRFLAPLLVPGLTAVSPCPCDGRFAVTLQNDQRGTSVDEVSL